MPIKIYNTDKILFKHAPYLSDTLTFETRRKAQRAKIGLWLGAAAAEEEASKVSPRRTSHFAHPGRLLTAQLESPPFLRPPPLMAPAKAAERKSRRRRRKAGAKATTTRRRPRKVSPLSSVHTFRAGGKTGRRPPPSPFPPFCCPGTSLQICFPSPPLPWNMGRK